MRKQKGRSGGFTLVELLVVIAIIALLMSILMPALARVRKQAKNVLCQSNLRQWGNCFAMYASDHDGYFMRGWTEEVVSTTRYNYDTWMEALRPYYKNRDLCLCPTASKPGSEMGTGISGGGTFVAWGVFPDPTGYIWVSPGDYGSYGTNGFINDPPHELEFIHAKMPAKNQWRTDNVKGGGNIPLFLDCQWTGGWPLHTDNPPDYSGQDWWITYWDDQVTRFCIDRHEGAVNSAFLDYSVRRVGLKELWRVKWHRSFDLNYPSPVWPPWMKGLKDF